MTFLSWPFLLCFLPLFFFSWHLTALFNRSLLGVVLLFFSLLFLACTGWHCLLLLMGLVLVNYLLGLLLSVPGEKAEGIRRHILLFLGVFLNTLPLFFLRSGLFGSSHPVFACTAASLSGQYSAVSFWFLIQTGWLVSVYRRQIEPQGFFRHLLFSSAFPYVHAGPVVRYEQMGRQYDGLHKEDAGDSNKARDVSEDLARGLSLLLLGLGKKILLADNLAPLADRVFAAVSSGAPLGMAEAWLGLFCLAFQIYFDFSGYTDMARGIARMAGLRLPENFRSPYRSTGFIDFWLRWHITLTSWFRDFLYIPLGGGSMSRLRQYLALMLTTLLVGLWYGGGLSFLVWGALNGLFIAINASVRSVMRGTAFEAVAASVPVRTVFCAITFLLVALLWGLFRMETLGEALKLYIVLLGLGISDPAIAIPAAPDLASGGLFVHGCFTGWQDFVLPLVSAFIVWGCPSSQEIIDGRKDGEHPWIFWKPTRPWYLSLALLAFFVLILLDRARPFIF